MNEWMNKIPINNPGSENYQSSLSTLYYQYNIYVNYTSANKVEYTYVASWDYSLWQWT